MDGTDAAVKLWRWVQVRNKEMGIGQDVYICCQSGKGIRLSILWQTRNWKPVFRPSSVWTYSMTDRCCLAALRFPIVSSDTLGDLVACTKHTHPISLSAFLAPSAYLQSGLGCIAHCRAHLPEGVLKGGDGHVFPDNANTKRCLSPQIIETERHTKNRYAQGFVYYQLS